MKKLTKYILILIFLFSVSISWAQEKTVSGTVTDLVSNEGLSSVVVSNLRTKKATTTAADGKFQLAAGAKDTLHFQLIGYETQNINVGNRSIVEVKLKESINELKGVVVIGYGTTTKQDLTGSVGVVDLISVTKAPVASITEGLAGRIAGLTVSALGGQPGDEQSITVRGGNSISQDNTPLYVIDGFPQENANIDAIHPNDIESISVLKDASATAIYGSRGANGVIIIETKKGKLGAPKITYEANLGFQQVNKFMDMMSVRDFVSYQIERDPTNMTDLYLTNPGKTIDYYDGIKGVDWQNLLLRDGFWNSHNVSVQGGSATTKYAISGSLLSRDGVIINSGYDRTQGRISLVQDLNKKLKATLNVNYSKIKDFGERTASEDLNTNNFTTFLMYRTWGYRPISGGMIDGSDLNGDDFIDSFYDEDATDSRINPIVSTLNVIRQKTRNNLRADASLNYQIAKNLVLKVSGGYASNNAETEAFNNSKTYRGYPTVNNINGVNGSYAFANVNEFLNANTLTYNKAISRVHKIELLAGYTFQGRNIKSNGYSVIHVPFEELGLPGMEFGEPSGINTSLSKSRLQSYLARANYNFSNRYLLTATLRADGSSKFSRDNRWGYFPSVAFAWRLKNEKFLKDILRSVTDAKLRISHGATGNNRIDDFATITALNMPYSAYYPFNNGKPVIGVNVGSFGNKFLKWETTVQTDIGLDLSLLNNRINIEADYYRKETRNMLLNANVPTSTGFSRIYQNIGKMLNQGIELSLNTVNINSKSFKWSSSFNISFNKNRILQLAESENTLLSAVGWNSGYNSTYLYNARVGEPLAMFYGYIWDGNYQYTDFDSPTAGQYVLKKNIASNGIDRANIRPGDIKYVDINGDGIVNEDDLTPIGNALPDHSGGFNNNFKYKNLSLNVFFQWSYGNQLYNANRMVFEGNIGNVFNINQFASYNDRWSPDNQDSKNFRVNGQGPIGVYSSKYIEDGSYLRLKTVSLDYNLPASVVKKIGAKTLTAIVAAQNLITWTRYSGMDPEVSTRHSALTPGFDFSAYPISRNITFGIRLGL